MRCILCNTLLTLGTANRSIEYNRFSCIKLYLTDRDIYVGWMCGYTLIKITVTSHEDLLIQLFSTLIPFYIATSGCVGKSTTCKVIENTPLDDASGQK